MPSRRAHQKSHHGCVNCKQRRVKCDEVRPTCSNCSRRHAQCEYDSVASVIWANDNACRQQSMTCDPKSLQETGPVTVEDSNLVLPGRCNSLDATAALPPSLILIDLELLMQWKDTTYRTFCRNPHTTPIWQCFVPQEALAEPFLMHGILALSAVHLARTKNEDLKSGYISTAVSHQNQALAVFRPLLVDINPANSKAMFAFASIITIYSFGFSQEQPDSTGPRTTIDALYQVLVFARGVHQILVKAADSLQDSMFKPLLQWDGPQQRLAEEARLTFKRLREAIHTLATDDTRHDYLTAVRCIQEGLAEIFGGSTAVATATRVAIRMPPRYVDLLREHDRLALVILAYYCTVLHRLRHNWCLDGWGARVAGALWSVLGGQWRDLMRWVMEDIFRPDFLTRSEAS